MEILSRFVLNHQEWSYYIIFLGTILQGEITLLVSMYLVIDKSLNLWLVLLYAVSAVIISDYFLYFLGRKIRNTKLGWKFYRKIKNSKKNQIYTYYISKNLAKMIIVSKFLIGANILIMTMIGWSKVKFGKFFKNYFFSVIPWFIFVSALSYFFASGAYFLKAEKIFKQVEIIIAAVFILFVLGEVFLKNVFQKFLDVELKSKKLKGALDKLNLEAEDESAFNNKVNSEKAEDLFKDNNNNNKDNNDNLST